MSSFSHISDDFPIKNVLIVDDEDSLRLLLVKVLQRAGFDFEQAKNANEALAFLETRSFDLVVSDIVMPGMDGIELLQRVKAAYPFMDVIIMTGYGSDYSYVDIMNAGASDYVTKPFNLDSILARIHRIAREKKNLIDLKKTNQELCCAIDRANTLAREAKEASKAKTFFLASMSHEIRTPLNGIVGYTDMLLDTRLDQEQKLYLKRAKNSCDTLLCVVNDILDFSKVEAGQLTLEHIRFDPEVVCFDTIDVVRTRVDESNVSLRVLIGDDVPGFVIGDPHRFRQVLLNLLSNAAKFTSTGSITLRMDTRKRASGHCLLGIRVSDTGIGIAQNKLTQIFSPFVQSDDGTANRYGGTGLGLAISKNIARKMGGDLWAESVENTGSTFHFTASFEIGEQRAADRVRLAALKGKNALLLSPVEKISPILPHELSLCGLNVVSLAFSQLDHFLMQHPEPPVDVVIVDFNSHDKQMIQQCIDTCQDVWDRCIPFGLIACAIPVPGIAQIFHQAGFNGFLPKPVSRRKLFDMIAYVIGVKTSEPGRVQKTEEIVTTHLLSENRKNNASILLAEDNPVNQKMTQLMLSKAGYCIDIAADGQAAVDKYTADPDAYDLIFMDINMPKMDGFEATQQIRAFEKQHPKFKRVPVLALTANVLEDFRQKCAAARMDDFLTKPIKRDVVFTAIQKWTGHASSQ